jgi:hypothetical protein
MSASLAIVANNPAPEPRAEEPLAGRIKRLQAEARSMAREHIAMLEEALHGMIRTAAEIADGGEAYPVGAREMARQLVTDTEARLLSLEVLMSRTGAR